MRNVRLVAAGAAASALVAVVISCGGSSSSDTSSPTTPSGACTPSASANTLVIQNNTICPSALTVTRGSQITVLNSDSRVHEMDSDPHPEHTDCPEINQVGFLSPGQSRQTSAMRTVRSCGFHDHNQPSTTSLQGTIVVQ